MDIVEEEFVKAALEENEVDTQAAVTEKLWEELNTNRNHRRRMGQGPKSNHPSRV